jgi:hypothetical protein
MIAPALAAGLLSGSACSSSLAPAAKLSTVKPTPSATDPASIARQDTAALLAAFAVPPGSVRSATEPAGTPSALLGPAPELSVPTSATSTGWWVADISADESYAWVKSHDVGDAKFGVGYGKSADEMSVRYNKAATPTLFSRSIDVDVAPLSADRSVIRVTVDDVYRPVKPAAEAVPVTPYLLAIVQPGIYGPVSKPTPRPTTVTVTDRSKITEIAGLINALPTLPDETLPCPSDSGARIRLDFETAANGTSLAEIVIAPSGCPSVSVSIAGTEQPTLDPGAAIYSGGLVGRITSILGTSLD